MLTSLTYKISFKIGPKIGLYYYNSIFYILYAITVRINNLWAFIMIERDRWYNQFKPNPSRYMKVIYRSEQTIFTSRFFLAFLDRMALTTFLEM